MFSPVLGEITYLPGLWQNVGKLVWWNYGTTRLPASCCSQRRCFCRHNGGCILLRIIAGRIWMFVDWVCVTEYHWILVRPTALLARPPLES